MRWIIGDIHGMYAPLATLVEAVGKRDAEAEFFFAGDYVNRGPDTRRVIDFLLTLPRARFIRGNHDDIFDHILCGKSYTDRAVPHERLLAFKWFLQHGLDATFMSYGVEWAELEHVARKGSLTALQQLIQHVPETHQRFIRKLPLVIEQNDLFIAHGYWDPNEAAESPSLQQRLNASSQDCYALIWNRFSEFEIQRPKLWQRTGYFGHTPVDVYESAMVDGVTPIVGPHIVLLDTGVALSATGRLTAYCVEARSFLQTNHFGVLLDSPAHE